LYVRNHVGIAFGIPAYRAAKSNVNECLRESGRSTASVSRHRTRNTLVVTEIALAFVLLICAGLMINTMIRYPADDNGVSIQSIC
jgi:hypothetical protein